MPGIPPLFIRSGGGLRPKTTGSVSMTAASGTRHRIFAALAVRELGREAARLLGCLSESQARAAAPLIESYSSDPAGPMAMDSLIAQMAASERFSSIAEIHPAWLLERLTGEPPRVVGIILRALPSSHVRYLLKNLPPMLRDRVPSMVESFAVRPEVLEIIRRRFEANFLPMRISKRVSHPGFEHLYFLKTGEIEALVRELGLVELAIALSGITGKALHMIFNRLDLKDAKRLQAKIKGLKSISPELYRQARLNILKIEGRHEGPEKMLISAGLAALASAMGSGHAEPAGLMQQKMPPSDAYLLKRFLDETRLAKNPKVDAERQAMVLRTVAELSADGRISPEWRRFDPDFVPEQGEGPDNWQDETVSLKFE